MVSVCADPSTDGRPLPPSDVDDGTGGHPPGVRLNAEFEDHAEHTYAQLVEDHPGWEDQPVESALVRQYGLFRSWADVFRRVGLDERDHMNNSFVFGGKSSTSSSTKACPRLQVRAHWQRDTAGGLAAGSRGGRSKLLLCPRAGAACELYFPANTSPAISAVASSCIAGAGPLSTVVMGSSACATSRSRRRAHSGGMTIGVPCAPSDLAPPCRRACRHARAAASVVSCPRPLWPRRRP